MNYYALIFVIILNVLIPVIARYTNIQIRSFINYVLWFNILYIFIIFAPKEHIQYKQMLMNS